MKLRLNSSRVNAKSVIYALHVHDSDGKLRISLQFDRSQGSVQLKHHAASSKTLKQERELIEELIQVKSHLSDYKGIEALGSLLSGAKNEIPVYKHLMTIFLLTEEDKVDKYHVSFDSLLEKLNLQNALLLAAECYIVMNDLFQQDNIENLSTEDYPRLVEFLQRSYSHESFTQALKWPTEGLATKAKLVEELLEAQAGQLESVTLYFMTLSGALIAVKDFLEESDKDQLALNWIDTTLTSPGHVNKGHSLTLWYPYSKSRVGRISRAIATTLNTLTYASGSKNIKQQTQNNLAHKFQEIVKTMSEVGKSEDHMGFRTNIGHMLITVKFDEKVSEKEQLQIGLNLLEPLKKLGQNTLRYLSRNNGFSSIE